jgi:putative FmdB family regulatory protein
MPMYEFECEECGARFEELVAAGTDSVTCRQCGSTRTTRRYSAQAASFKLVKSPGEARAQEARNAKLHASTKAAFKERRRKAREARKAGGTRG